VRVTTEHDPATGAIGFELTAVRRADDLAHRRRLPLTAKGQWLCSADALAGLAGHANLAGGPLPADAGCPGSARRVAGIRVCRARA
jgi:hypothetical protein